MTDLYFTHRFDATIASHAAGTYRYTVVYLAPEPFAELPLDRHPRLRVEADVAGITFKGAWQPAKGRWYLMLPKAPLRKAGLAIGDEVEVAFRVIDQDDVEIPEELGAMLASDPECRKVWQTLSAGKQRTLAHMVSSARTAATRSNRVAQVRSALRGVEPMPGPPRKSRAVPRG